MAATAAFLGILLTSLLVAGPRPLLQQVAELVNG